MIRDAQATQKLEEFQARKKAEAEAGKYKAEIRQKKIESVVENNANKEKRRRDEFLIRQAEADQRMQMMEHEKERQHAEKRVQAMQREEHIKNVLDQNIIREEDRKGRIERQRYEKEIKLKE